MIIINTKIVLYMKRSCGSELRINDILKFAYNEMLNEEYDSETTLQAERFEARWGKSRKMYGKPTNKTSMISKSVKIRKGEPFRQNYNLVFNWHRMYYFSVVSFVYL